MSQQDRRLDPPDRCGVDVGWYAFATSSRREEGGLRAPLAAWLRRKPPRPPLARGRSGFFIEHLEIRSVPSGVGLLSSSVLASIVQPSSGPDLGVAPTTRLVASALPSATASWMAAGEGATRLTGDPLISSSAVEGGLTAPLSAPVDVLIARSEQDVTGASTGLVNALGIVPNKPDDAVEPVGNTLDGTITAVLSTASDVLNASEHTLAPVGREVTNLGTGLASTVGDARNVGPGNGTGGTIGSGSPVTPNPPVPPNPPESSRGGPPSPPSASLFNPIPPTTEGQTVTSNPPGASGGPVGEGGQPADGSTRGGSAIVAGPGGDGQSSASVPITRSDTSETAPEGGLPRSSASQGSNATRPVGSQVANPARPAPALTPIDAEPVQIEGPGGESGVSQVRVPADLSQDDLDNLQRSLEQLIRQFGAMGLGLADQFKRFRAIDLLIGLGIASMACVVIRRWERRRHAKYPTAILGASCRPGPFYFPRGWR